MYFVLTERDNRNNAFVIQKQLTKTVVNISNSPLGNSHFRRDILERKHARNYKELCDWPNPSPFSHLFQPHISKDDIPHLIATIKQLQGQNWCIYIFQEKGFLWIYRFSVTSSCSTKEISSIKRIDKMISLYK